MTTKKIFAITVFTNLFFLVVLAAVLVMVGPLGAGTTAKPSQVAPGCALVAPAEFVPVHKKVGYFNLGDAIQATTNDPPARLLARIEPPNGATLTKFGAVVLDNSPRIVEVKLWRQVLATGAREEMASVVSAGSSTALQILETTTFAAGTATVTDAYTYFVLIRFTGFGDKLKFFYSWVECAP